MSVVIRMVLSFVIICGTGAAFAGPIISATGGADIASMEALSNGKLTFWVSTRFPSNPLWPSLVADLRKDYPGLKVEWQIFQPDALLPALNDARRKQQGLDVVFADNYAQEGPMVQGRMGRIMVGRPRHGERGWWMILNDAPDQKIAEAFLIWLEQPKDWRPEQPATQLLTADDQTQIRAITTEVVQAFNALPVQPPQSALDQAIALFDWNPRRLWHTPEDEKLSYSLMAEQLGGNARLAFVTRSTLEHGEDSFGVLHSFLVLRKEASRWKVLLLDMDTSLAEAEQWAARFDGIGLNNEAPGGSTKITLLEPGNGESATRFPRTEIAFKQEGGIGELTVIEFQFFDPARKEWSAPGLRAVTATEDVTRMPAPFGVAMQPHRWRVWSVNKAGVVRLSEWRTISFTN
jgi:hypothetical protein